MIRKTLTILFADVQGYTSRTGRQTREQHEKFIIELQSFIKKQTKEKNGNFVKSMGDGFMLTFESPTDAIACGINIQKQIPLSSASIRKQEKPILFRIGVSTGEVMVDEGGDVFGDAVNIASRVETFATPGEVYISEATYLAMNKSEFNAINLGSQKFKNVRQEIRVYRVFEGSADVITSLQRPISQKQINTFGGIIVVLAIGLLLFFFTQKKLTDPPTTPESNIHAQFERMLRDKDFHGIIETANNILQSDPTRGDLYAFTGAAFMHLGDFQRAENYLKKAIEFDQENPGVYYMLSNLYAGRERFDEAIVFLAEYLRREQNSVERKIAINRMQELEQLKSEYAQQSNQQVLLHEASEPLQPSVEQKPDAQTQDNFVTNSPITEKQNVKPSQPSKSEPRTPRQQPKSIGSTRQKLQALRKQLKEYMLDDDYTTAMHILGAAEEEFADSYSFLVWASKLYLKMDDHGKAEEMLLRALDLNPDNPTPYFGLSLIYEEIKEYQEAIRMLNEFIYRDNNDIRRKKTEEKIELLRHKMEKSQ
ncbi:MAG: tetratricopeptide repeat protein [Candidatus Omnitrophica bacterium]|nr:tetratricopeptide repeat protein [Candidatus Omnitrophota bacterium]